MQRRRKKKAENDTYNVLLDTVGECAVGRPSLLSSCVLVVTVFVEEAYGLHDSVSRTKARLKFHLRLKPPPLSPNSASFAPQNYETNRNEGETGLIDSI